MRRPMDTHEAALLTSFRSAQLVARKLVLQFTARTDQHLREMLTFALEDQTISGYPFVFTCAFSRRQEDYKKVTRLAAAIHLAQSSTFITDDIFDHGEIRYGREAMHLRYGIPYAVIVAELLQATAQATIDEELHSGRFGRVAAVSKLLNRLLGEVYLGQYLDLHSSADPGITRRQYYRIISLGAGRFFAAIARCGALLAKKPSAEVEALTRFGHAYGMALFIADDVIDIVGTPSDTYKSARSDLRQRRMRLPMILALQFSKPRPRAILRGFLRCNQASVAEIVRIIEEVGAIEACQMIARRYLRRALRSLEPVQTRITRGSLHWLAEDLMNSWPLRPGRPRTASRP